MTPRLPTCTPRQVVAALQKAGWLLHHSTGSHLQLRRPDDLSARVTVPMHARDLKRGVLKRILKQARLNDEDFRNLL